MSDPEGLRDRLTRSGEDALGKLAQDLLENPLVNSAISHAFEARERAVQAQEAALGALNIPSAADVERLTRRLRSVSQRLEGIEDAVDRLDQSLEQYNRPGVSGSDERLEAIESQLSKLLVELTALGSGLDSTPTPMPREQERLEVDVPPAAAKPKPKPKPKPRAKPTPKPRATAKAKPKPKRATPAARSKAGS
jgi:hypothetical protein